LRCVVAPDRYSPLSQARWTRARDGLSKTRAKWPAGAGEPAASGDPALVAPPGRETGGFDYLYDIIVTIMKLSSR
jgi:hypothetical protein